MAFQDSSVENIEANMHIALYEMSENYEADNLKPIHEKTEVSLFHQNKSPKREFKIVWEGIHLTHKPEPKHLGVVLDLSLSYNRHCLDERKKVAGRNNLLRLLTTKYRNISRCKCFAGLV